MQAHHRREAAAHDDRRLIAYEQAQWVAWAYHDPKHMPAFERVAGKAEKASDEADQAKVRGYLISLSEHRKKRKAAG